jgi:transcriptional regulator with XRE-family HTH domain
MPVSDKIKALLSLKGKKSYELAEYLQMSPQAMRNKLSRDSFSAADLIKIADFLHCDLAFTISDNQKISLELSDIAKK